MNGEEEFIRNVGHFDGSAERINTRRGEAWHQYRFSIRQILLIRLIVVHPDKERITERIIESLVDPEGIHA